MSALRKRCICRSAWPLSSSVSEAVQSDVARLACAAYEQAMQAPDREHAVETALQVLFDVSA